MHVLPDVRLVVIDEWCPQTGVPPKANVKKTQEIIDNRKKYQHYSFQKVA